MSPGEHGKWEPRGTAMAAAVHRVLCTLRTSLMASNLAIGPGAGVPIAPAPVTGLALRVAHDDEIMDG